MPFFLEEQMREQTLRSVAQQMMVAARTAPKGRGLDNLVIGMVEGDILETIANKMLEIGNRGNAAFFIRDATSIQQTSIAVFIGAKISAAGIPECGYCGFKNCESKIQYPDTPCAFNTVDLGIALGSAVDVAAANKVDNRILFSAGKAAIELGLFDDNVKILFGIPLSCSSKNPFFDRK